MEQQIATNNRKTFFLFVLFFVFFAGISLVTVYTSGNWYVGLGVFGGSMIYVFWSYAHALKRVLKLTHAIPVTKKTHRRLCTTVENLSITVGIKTPAVYVINDPALNAFAAGRSPDKSLIGITTGLLEVMNRQELEGVIAHELSHIINRDVRVNTLAFAMVAGMSLLVDLSLRGSLVSSTDSRNNSNTGGILLILVFSIIAFILSILVKSAISKRREYQADVTGAQITKYPLGLASALEKIARHGSVLKKSDSATAHMFLSNPTKSDLIDNWLGSHPPLKSRIAKLRQLEKAGL